MSRRRVKRNSNPNIATEIQKSIDAKMRRAENEGDLIVTKGAETGAERMRDFIMSTGTGWVGKGARAIPEGRIDTGEMHDAVAVRKERKGHAEFGWVVDYEEYFGLQEKGFTQPSGHKVPPMHAFLNATMWTQEEVSEKLSRMVRRLSK